MNNSSALGASKLIRLLGGMAVFYSLMAPYPNGGVCVAQQPVTSRQERPHVATYYAEGWKASDTRQMQERILRLRLDRFVPSYETVLTDVSGFTRYRLTVEPTYFRWDHSRLRMEKNPNAGDSHVNLWQVGLYEPDEKVSLLVANRDQGHVIDESNTLSTLAPIEDTNWLKVGIFGVPILSSRVIRVEGTYCLINVKGYQLTPKDRAFEWIELEIEFTNTKPDIAALRARRNR